jgi:rsbT antagonist protein RsbS
MDRIPILKMGEFLLVTIQVDMHDRLALALQEDLTDCIAEVGARGVLIDISSLEIVDSFIGRMFANLAAMARVLDAATVVVGMKPAVAAGDPLCRRGQHLRLHLDGRRKPQHGLP